jgi:hypothetical protein
MLERQTIRQRVAFALALGYGVLNLVDDVSDGKNLARAALDDALNWLRGQPLSARQLTDHLMDEREEGVLMLSKPTDSPHLGNAWLTIETVVGYVAWQAWRQEGPLEDSLVAEFDETVLDHICIYAAGAGLDTVRIIQLLRRVESILTPDIPDPMDLVTRLT